MKKTESKTYSVVADFSGKKHTATGSSVSDALKKIVVRNVKGRCVVTVNGKSKILSSIQAYRLFSGHGLMREVALKQISSLFDGL